MNQTSPMVCDKAFWSFSSLCWPQAWMPPARSRWETSQTPQPWSPGSSPWLRLMASNSPTASRTCLEIAPPSTSHTKKTSILLGTWGLTRSMRCPLSPAGWTWRATLLRRPSPQVRPAPLYPWVLLGSCDSEDSQDGLSTSVIGDFFFFKKKLK